MAKNSDTQACPTEPQPKHPSCWFGKLFLIAAVLLALILSSTALYKSCHLIKRQNRETKGALVALLGQKRTIEQFKTDVQEQIQPLKLKLEQVVHSQQVEQAQGKYLKQDWLLLKARYYLELAQINVQWSETNDVSRALLQQADAVLKPLVQQNIFPIRQAIAKEILQLKTAVPLDIPGLLSQLDALQATVSSLSMKPDAKLSPTQAASSSTNWRDTLQSSFDTLSKLVVIKHHSDDTAQFFSPQYEALLRESIRFDIKQAQWAILQRNQAVFQQALTQALTSIKQAFSHSSQASALINQIESLQKTTFPTAKPIILRSLQELNQLIDSPEVTPSVKEGDPS